MTNKYNLSLFLVVLGMSLCACSDGIPSPGVVSGSSEEVKVIDPAKVDRARDLVSWTVEKNISTPRVEPFWMGDSDRFWYLDQKGEDKTFWIVDATNGEKRPAFDHQGIREALQAISGATLKTLPFDRFRYPLDESKIEFSYDQGIWSCAADGSSCLRVGDDPVAAGLVLSPDRSKGVFLKDNNLWLTEFDTNRETALTVDGIRRYGYGATYGNNANVVALARSASPEAPIIAWSPDSRYVLTHHLDERHIATMPLISYITGDEDLHPKTYEYPLGMPGDELLATSTLVVLDTKNVEVLPIEQSLEPQGLSTRLELGQAFWGGARSACFVVHDRPFKKARLDCLDLGTGKLEHVLTEESTTFLAFSQVTGHQFNTNGNSARVIPETGELLWYSQRDGWGHLYLYDMATGVPERQITKGEWVVHEIVHIDQEQRVLYFTAGGRETGRNPYYAHLYRVPLDGGEPALLTPEHADHDITPNLRSPEGTTVSQSFSPSGRYFVDTYARADAPPVSVIRTSEGQSVTTFHEPDVSYVSQRITHWPEPFIFKARDGVTDLYGALFRPSDFDAGMRYPVIDYIYPGPFNIWTPRSMIDLRVYFEAQSLAELGFVVMIVDAMGSAGRSKAFHDVAYGNLQDAGLPDHIAALKQLGERYAWMDTERVGILGISSGGFAAALAMLTYPGVYDVGVSAAGIYDMRIGFAGWTERFQGMPGEGFPPENYQPFILERIADQLEGPLMVVFGNLDENVHPAVTHRFINALNMARKPYDLVLMVDRNHGFGRDPYYIQRVWQHFVENLQNKKMPAGFRLD